jgi:mono/diheme cytochrome c family protein
MVSAADNKLFSVFLEPSHGRGDGSVLTRVVLTRQYYAEGATIGARTLLLGIGGITRNIIGDVTGNGALAFGRHAAFALGLCASITGAAAMPADPARGEKLARHWCASCHIVANDQNRGADNVPPFTTIARKPGFDGGKIAQFLMDPHPKMPDMQLSRDEAKDLGAYIASLAH